ncbi:ribose-5-phosphate isomerase [Prauserella sp. PE36]|uniref:RpiB/LacA/LacB family sugar-phosphate isomerase n=1 Tax=Prauserella sp. PE36 TaxID=1504709 RepID=UPI000DE1F873|nr:RpiB/LacA/LacB family sugar-phosphate isomerase [Prauserella sp. PE36]RBM17695.1 ribose-5-phosphate isomerase [Prauserella sp. PE36]
MRIAVVADHNALPMKAQLGAWLTARGHEVNDRGVHAEEVVDYPLLCEDVCAQVLSGSAEFAIVLGGSGSGEQIACNKIRGIRAALCHDTFVAEVARGNNDANVLVMGAKVIAADAAERILDVWLATRFRGGRHADRVAMIMALDRGESLRQPVEEG